MNSKYVKCFTLFVLLFTCQAKNTDNAYVKQVFYAAMPSELKNIQIIDQATLTISDYRKYHRYDPEETYYDDLKALHDGSFRSYIVGDFNKNGKKDIAVACRVPLKNESYLVILEEENETYKYITRFKFNFFKFFLYVGSKNSAVEHIIVYFQSGTDWRKEVYWNGEQYSVKAENAFGH